MVMRLRDNRGDGMPSPVIWPLLLSIVCSGRVGPGQSARHVRIPPNRDGRASEPRPRASKARTA